MEINQTINRPYEGLTKEQILKTLGEKIMLDIATERELKLELAG